MTKIAEIELAQSQRTHCRMQWKTWGWPCWVKRLSTHV